MAAFVCLTGAASAAELHSDNPGADQSAHAASLGGLTLLKTIAGNASRLTANKYKLFCTLRPTNNNRNFGVRLSEDNGATYKNSNYNFANLAASGSGQTFLWLSPSNGQSATGAQWMVAEAVILNMQSTSIDTAMIANSFYVSSAPALVLDTAGSAYTGDQNAKNGLQVIPQDVDTGTLAVGSSCSLYSIAE